MKNCDRKLWSFQVRGHSFSLLTGKFSFFFSLSGKLACKLVCSLNFVIELAYLIKAEILSSERASNSDARQR